MRQRIKRGLPLLIVLYMFMVFTCFCFFFCFFPPGLSGTNAPSARPPFPRTPASCPGHHSEGADNHIWEGHRPGPLPTVHHSVFSFLLPSVSTPFRTALILSHQTAARNISVIFFLFFPLQEGCKIRRTNHGSYLHNHRIRSYGTFPYDRSGKRICGTVSRPGTGNRQPNH